MKTAVLIPAYNAEKTIGSVFSRIPDNALDIISMFIVVDDGSTDNTRQVVERLKDQYNIVLISHPANMGYGAAQKTGYKAALEMGADAVVLLHADGQHPPEQLLDMIHPIQDGAADVVGGLRPRGLSALRCGMPMHKMLGDLFLTRLLNLFLRVRLYSYHSGYKAYTRRALETIMFSSLSDYFDFDTEMLIGALKSGVRIVEVPVDRSYGDEICYLNPIKYGLAILRVIWKSLRS